MSHSYPILEYDPDPHGVIDIDLEADRLPDMPEHCVICFFRGVFEQFVQRGAMTPFTTIGTEMGDHPVYLHSVGGRSVAVLHQGMGAALAAFLLDEMIARGGRKFIACGGAGVLDRTIDMGQVLVPVAAVRDEGASYHYLPPAREVAPTPGALAAVEATLDRHGVAYVHTKTWTTDGFFRETKGKVAQRRAEGCLTVEMEAAAMFAVARFRQVEFAQMLYAGDNLDAEQWEFRDWPSNMTVREKLVELATEACLML